MPVTAATGKERDKIHVQIHRRNAIGEGEERERGCVSYRREEIELFMSEKSMYVYVCVCV